jgi:hypothetical protein
MTDPAINLELNPAPLPEDADRKSVRIGFLGRTPPFTKRQRRVFWIASTAGFFDQYDRALLSLALKQIQAGLKIAESHLGAMLSIVRLGYLLSLRPSPTSSAAAACCFTPSSATRFSRRLSRSRRTSAPSSHSK